MRTIDDNLIYVGEVHLTNTELATNYTFGATVWGVDPYNTADRVLIEVEVQALRYSFAGVATTAKTPIPAGQCRWFVLDKPSRELLNFIRDAAGCIVHCTFFKHRT